jgi:hypothetical protein
MALVFHRFFSVQEMASIYPDRVVAIKGTLDNMSRAENAISAKLRECYEKDTVNSHKACILFVWQDSGTGTMSLVSLASAVIFHFKAINMLLLAYF